MHMQLKFPALVAQCQQDTVIWRGPLQPREEGTRYRVRIHWQVGDEPKVYVENPGLVPGAPHVYPGGYLCLYYPADRTWHRGRLIADTIVPLTAEWLLFYEFWRLTGVWHGPEAPHAPDEPKEAPGAS